MSYSIVSLRPGQLVALRSAVVAGLVLALAVNQQFLQRSPTAEMLLWTTGALALFNLATWWPGRHAAEVSSRDIEAWLLVDIAVLTFFFYFAGGATHPFVDLYLMPAAIAAVSVSLRPALFVALLTLACYLLLVKFHVPLPDAREGVTGFHCVAMWLKYLLCGAFVAGLLHSVASRLREEERRQARALRRREHDEYLARAGSLAASAAHEMSTPLCTMAVVVNEILQEAEDRNARHALRIISQQIDACRRILAEILTYGQDMIGHPGKTQPADRFMQELIERWRVLRLGAKLDFVRWGSEPAPAIPTHWGVGHAVLNLLNNAADASPETVEMHCKWTAAELRIEVLDRGAGVAPEILASPGERCVTTKRDRGFGIGLVLARSIVEGAGGRLTLSNRPDGGARAEIVLPLPGAAGASEPERPCGSHGFVVRYHGS